MTEQQASRTLVKSPPELWAECSDPSALARHLGDGFGEIRIARLEPESTVAWEGEDVSGTVKLEPSGWGTRVTLTVSSEDPEPEPPPEPEPSPLPPAARRRGLMARLLARALGPQPVRQPVASPALADEPALPPEPEPSPELIAALDSLGSAHHRPFSRA
jgi:hypothetical protein